MNASPENPSLSMPHRTGPPVGAYAIAAGATLVMAWATCTAALTDWDSWCYTSEAIRARPSILCLGRWWFIAIMRWAYQAAGPLGFDAVHGYVPMRIAVGILTAGAVVAVMHWTYLLTARRRAAVAAGVVAVASPTLAAYCSAVMTEGPTLLFLTLAFIGWEKAIRVGTCLCSVNGQTPPGETGTAANDAHTGRPPVAPGTRSIFRMTPPAWAVLAGMCFGVAVDMREPVALLCAWPIVSCFIDRPGNRWRLLGLAAMGAAATLAFGVAMSWAWRPEKNPLVAYREWAEYMEQERALRGFHPLANAAFFLVHCATASPVAVLALGAWGILRIRKGRREGGDPIAGLPRRAAWVGVSSLPFAAAVWWNPDLSFNFRLLLPLAWTLAPLVGFAVEAEIGSMKTARRQAGVGPGATPGVGGRLRRVRWRWAVLLGLVLLLVSGAFVARLIPHFDSAAYQDQLFRSLQVLPDNAVVLAGPGSPAAKYLHDLGIRPRWKVILTGWNFAGRFDLSVWTGDGLTAGVEREMRLGRRAFVNNAAKGWMREGQHNPEWDALRDMVARFRTRPAAGELIELLGRRGTN